MAWVRVRGRGRVRVGIRVRTRGTERAIIMPAVAGTFIGTNIDMRPGRNIFSPVGPCMMALTWIGLGLGLGLGVGVGVALGSMLGLGLGLGLEPVNDRALRFPHGLVVDAVRQPAELLELGDARLAARQLLVARQHRPHVDHLLDLRQAALERTLVVPVSGFGQVLSLMVHWRAGAWLRSGWGRCLD